MSRLVSCQYCGTIHESKFDCGRKPVRKKQFNNKNSFRSTNAWNKKRNEIRRRDLQLCQICIRKLYDTVHQYTFDGLSVHHAISLESDFSKRLDNDNLLTLCEHHHEMAECGDIPYKVIKNIIDKQEGKKQ